MEWSRGFFNRLMALRCSRRILGLGRVGFSRAVRWLTGHAFLRLQNFRAGTTALSTCRLCGRKPERADHILLECPRLSGLRTDCFGSAYIDGEEESPDWEVGDFLKFITVPEVANLEEEELEDSVEEASSGEDPSPIAPRVSRRPPHTISTSDSG